MSPPATPSACAKGASPPTPQSLPRRSRRLLPTTLHLVAGRADLDALAPVLTCQIPPPADVAGELETRLCALESLATDLPVGDPVLEVIAGLDNLELLALPAVTLRALVEGYELAMPSVEVVAALASRGKPWSEDDTEAVHVVMEAIEASWEAARLADDCEAGRDAHLDPHDCSDEECSTGRTCKPASSEQVWPRLQALHVPTAMSAADVADGVLHARFFKDDEDDVLALRVLRRDDLARGGGDGRR